MSTAIDLRGPTVRLRPTIEQDRRALVAIRSTEEVRRWWRGEDLEADFDRSLDDAELVQLTIETTGGQVIGQVQYVEESDPDYRHASIDIFVDPAVHRRGYATESIRLLTDHLFDEAGHHRMTIDPAADNAAAIACYAKVGFRPVGVMRSYERRADGEWTDGMLMEMLATDRRFG